MQIMKRLWMSGFLLLMAFFIKAQENKQLPYRFSVFTGLNMCRNLNIDSLETNKAYLPFIGLNVNLQKGPKSILTGGVLFSLKGSNIISNNQAYRLSYFDFHGYYKYCLTDYLNVYGGLQPSFLVNAKYKKADYRKDLTSSFDQFELNIPVGIELAVQKNVWLGLAYDIPNPYCKYENFKITLNIVLNTEKFKAKNDSSKAMATRQIRQLKESVLFVRLQSGKKSAEALQKTGNENEAEKLLLESRKENIEIIKAFRSKFNFCPVYFFYADQTGFILKKEFYKRFLNDSLHEDSTIVPNSQSDFPG